MALKGTKNIALSYQSMIGDQVAVYMTAQIPESGRSNSNKTIQDLDLYEANKAECREDMAAFDEMLFELEDQQTAAEETPEESEKNQEMEGIQ
ncbi:hypothetical protein H6A32_13040 [Drancourtella massiliensis]|uniref:Uncharacterized protein n=1 Tax=Drancourtella massiliensis TaxID=1632013 RepID=A0ABS2EJP5_9FIRM|nr:hypothetical protein [Drancourtella massiliensis]MBM6745210.1 hypothetical protein [Drancourtella massiliensis]